MHLRRSRFTSIFVLPNDRVLPHFAQSPVEGNAMQNTTIGNTTVSLPSLDEAGGPVSKLCALFDRAGATAPDNGSDQKSMTLRIEEISGKGKKRIRLSREFPADHVD